MSMSPIPTFPAPPMRGRKLLRPSDLIIPAALAVLAAMLTFTVLRAGPGAGLPVDLSVASMADPDTVGATTRASVMLTNRGQADVRPRFSVTWLPYPYYWRIVSGPAVLRPGDTATYIVAAPDPASAPPDGTTFTLRVNDAASITYVTSKPLFVSGGGAVVRNPNFKLWAADPFTRIESPAGWQPYERRGAGDLTIVEPVDAMGVPAAHLRVRQDGLPDPGRWSHTGLTQEIAFPDSPLQFTMLSHAPFVAQTGGWPLTAFGFEVSDAKNGLIWVLFQQTGRGDLEYDLPSGHHIKVFDVPLGEWATRDFDLAATYRSLNWAPAGRVTLKLFIAASSEAPADIDGFVARAGIAPGATGQP